MPMLARSGSYRFELYFRINRFSREIGEHEIRRIYRSAVGDWCAEIMVADRVWVEVFDYHTTVALMRALKVSGAEIADEMIDQGAEGEDTHSLARRADDLRCIVLAAAQRRARASRPGMSRHRLRHFISG